MEAQLTKTSMLTLQPLMRLELLVASLLPASAILLVGVVGTRLLMPSNVLPFIVIFLLCAVAIFFGEFALISMLQRAINGQFSELIGVGQAYLAGNKERRAVINEDQELTTTFAKVLNALLDFATQQEHRQIAPKEAVVQDEEPLKKQLKQFAHEVAPVMDADLREKAEIATGDLGIVIDACNYLIEELVQQVKWTRLASEQVINSTREMLDRSIEFAQTSETQMLRLSQTTETGEKLVTFVQRLSSTLQMCVDLAQETQAHLLQKGNLIAEKSSLHTTIVDSAQPMNVQHEQLKEDTQQQIQLLEEALKVTQKYTTVAESMIGDLYAIAQHIHISSTGVLSTAERISSLVTVAERWRSTVAAFRVPGEEYRDNVGVDKSEIQTINVSPMHHNLGN